MDKKSWWKGTLKGAGYVFVPMHALKDVVGIKDSAQRIKTMVQTRKPVPMDEATMDPEAIAFEKDAAAGKAMLMELEEHDRFNEFVTRLEWSQEDLDNQTKALKRAHFIRFAILIFSATLLPYILYEYGFLRATFCIAMIAYTAVTCVKTTCMLVQLQEKALWSFDQLRSRPNHWLFRRAFWIQD